MKRSVPFHPFIFAVFPIVSLFSRNAAELWFSDVWMALVLAIGGTLILLAIACLLLRDIRKAGFIVSGLWILFYSYGHTYGAIEGVHVAGLLLGRHRFLLLAWALLAAGMVVSVVRSGRDGRLLSRVLNVVAIVLVAQPLAGIVSYHLRTDRRGGGVHENASDRAVAVTSGPDTSADIYYIILDGYARQSVLQDVFGFDNGPFIRALAQRGFYVAEKSCSNYVLTFLSLASSLNFEYINNLTDRVGESSQDRAVPYEMIQNNRAKDFLRSRGYRYINFNSGWGATQFNSYADVNISNRGFSEFYSVLIRTTLLRVLEYRLVGNAARERILYTFDKLGDMPRTRGPKFVFAHIVAPHPPFIFGKNGEPVEEARMQMDTGGWVAKEAYINQLQFINTKVLQLLDRLLADPERVPIVILQGDHGSEALFPNLESWEHPTDAMRRERGPILNAYLLPEKARADLYDSISPVNTFRLLFNTCFDADFELLEDRCYYSSYQFPFRFEDITEVLHSTGP